MKSKILILTIILSFTLFSCDKLKEAAIVNIDTTLTVNIPLQDQTSLSVLKSENFTADLHPFTGAAMIDLRDNADLKNYIDNIKTFTINDALATITGLTVDDEISNLFITATLNNVTYNIFKAGTKVFSLSNSTDFPLMLDQIKTMVGIWSSVGYDKIIIVTITGNSKVLLGSRLKLNVNLPSTVGYTPLT
jgi:hypothetical protein